MKDTGTAELPSAVRYGRDFAGVFRGRILIDTTMYVTFVLVVVFADDIGLRAGAGAFALATIGGASTLGLVGIVYATDSVGRLPTFTLCFAAIGVVTITLVMIDSTVALWMLAVVPGLRTAARERC